MPHNSRVPSPSRRRRANARSIAKRSALRAREPRRTEQQLAAQALRARVLTGDPLPRTETLLRPPVFNEIDNPSDDH